MRLLKTKSFTRLARKEGIKDTSLLQAITDIERGLVDADLGGGLIKQRIARSGKGKSGGYRTIIAYRSGKRAVFLYGFAKKDLENISKDDERDLRDFGELLLSRNNRDIDLMIEAGELKEINYDKKDQ